MAARSLDEALDHLDRYGEVTRILAGGTDLMIALRSAQREGEALPDYLLDVSGLPDCRTIREEGGRVILGSAVTFRTLENHPIIKQSLPLLAAAATRMGSVQVRRLATIGGNVGTASPAGDGITPLAACAAEARLFSKNGNRTLPVSDLISAPGRTRLAAGELIHSFSFRNPGTAAPFFFPQDHAPAGRGHRPDESGRSIGPGADRKNCLRPVSCRGGIPDTATVEGSGKIVWLDRCPEKSCLRKPAGRPPRPCSR